MNTSDSSCHIEKQQKLKIINWLIEYFPAAFFRKTRYIKPLKIGILEDILAFHQQLDTPPFNKKILRDALTYYCTSPAYLSAQKEGKERIDLFGNEMGLVTSEQAKYARLRYERQYLTPKAKQATPLFEQPKDNSHPPSLPAKQPSD
ncbi:MAG: ProQ/FinO family protein [Legionellaceae bacterium]|nr:ProQ/FinO family protein [Legionellaceae bacterium]